MDTQGGSQGFLPWNEVGEGGGGGRGGTWAGGRGGSVGIPNKKGVAGVHLGVRGGLRVSVPSFDRKT